MKGMKLIKKSILPQDRQSHWLRRLNPRRRNTQEYLDADSDLLPSDGLSLNIMSFNIRRGTKQDGKNHWIFRRKLVQEVLTQYRPDVLGLQEALDFQIEEIKAILPGYANVGAGNLGGSEGMHNAIFYDAAKFDLADEGTIWFSDTPAIPGSKGWGNIMPRIFTWARLVEKESRQSFYFYNAHLDHISLRSRKKSVVFLIRHIQTRLFPDPFIVTGDFNAGEKSAPIKYLKGIHLLNTKPKLRVLNPEPLVDTFRACYPNLRRAATFHGYNRFLLKLKIDYIFVPSSVRVDDAQIIQLRRKRCYPSDHFPLTTRIYLPNSISR
jgi:endonuclease/exonuclease/phosphatase family metal-dependent hydrolase